jgi:hypothetical protein
VYFGAVASQMTISVTISLLISKCEIIRQIVILRAVVMALYSGGVTPCSLAEIYQLLMENAGSIFSLEDSCFLMLAWPTFRP